MTTLFAAEIIARWSDLTVLVIGDAMLDSYLQGAADRLCQEAPVPIVSVNQRQDFAGGAANTAANLAALGANTSLLSVIGRDGEGERLCTVLKQNQVQTRFLTTDASRITLSKQRILGHNHLLLRLDQGTSDQLSANLEQQIISALEELYFRCDVIIISDYGYGIITPRIVEALALLRSQQPKVLAVDSKRLELYRQLRPSLVKPNYEQTLKLLSLSQQSQNRIQQIKPLGDRLLHITGAERVAATFDREGSMLFEVGKSVIVTPTNPAPSAHTSGAGDSFISAATLAIAAGATSQMAMAIATSAAELVVADASKRTCTHQELLQSLHHKPIYPQLPTPYSPLPL